MVSTASGYGVPAANTASGQYSENIITTDQMISEVEELAKKLRARQATLSVKHTVTDLRAAHRIIQTANKIIFP